MISSYKMTLLVAISVLFVGCGRSDQRYFQETAETREKLKLQHAQFQGAIEKKSKKTAENGSGRR